MASILMNSNVEGETFSAAGVRLQKVLAAAGVGSRRKCEELIAAGRVAVDGVTVTEMGRRVDPLTAVVHVDGARVNVREDLVYLALNKPRGVLSSMSDPHGRPTVADLVADRSERLFHVGRLDADSEGLLLLTNDGDLAHRLMHPSFGVHKTYLAEVPAPVTADLGRRLRDGIELEDGPVRVDSYRLVQVSGERALVEVRLHEGRNHIVRRMLAAAGYPVQRLVRTAIGTVLLGGLRPGALRPLTATELAELHRAVEQPRPDGIDQLPPGIDQLPNNVGEDVSD
jgi:23S rRNA pseudouridine2605 synthase